MRLQEMTENLPEHELQALLSLPEEDVLCLLGKELIGRSAAPQIPSHLIERAERWLNAQKNMLRKAVCESDKIKEIATTDTDQMAIALATLEILVSLVIPVNPITLTALLIKKGLTSFCSTKWKEDE
ncbi:MAG: hypothetical protein MI867_25495 [Pseudomonadales bacterium]|nr:hypothetical protein [Pseudomonadales bacterium]